MKRCRASGCLLFFALLPVSLTAADPLVAGDAQRHRLGGHLELLSDATRGMTLSQVMGGSANWQLTPDAEPNLGFSTGAAWVRFQIEGVGHRSHSERIHRAAPRVQGSAVLPRRVAAHPAGESCMSASGAFTGMPAA